MTDESRPFDSKAAKRAQRAGRDHGDVVEEINRDHALVMAGDKVLVLRETVSAEGTFEARYLSVDSFQSWLANRKVSVGDGKVPAAKIWLASPHRRQYLGITFAPEGAPDSYYNLWRGFDIEPREGDCSLFKEHLWHGVCGENEALFDWVFGWFAHLFQRPHEKVGTALVLRGKQGTGKTKVGEVIGSMLGSYSVAVADPRYITGRFNSHLSRCLLLHADEAVWAGDRTAEGKLKDLVTGHYHLIELKGKEPFRVRNLVRLLVTGNPDWIVPAGLEERRFAVVDVGDGREQDHEFFAELDRQMDSGGREALLHELLAFDLSKVNLRRVPDTGALMQQKVASLAPEESWWFDRLHAGVVLEDHDGWKIIVPCVKVFDSYIRHAERIGIRRRSAETGLGIKIKELVPKLVRKRQPYMEAGAKAGEQVSRRGYCYEFPSLGDCRAAFEQRIGPVVWGEEEDCDLP